VKPARIATIVGLVTSSVLNASGVQAQSLRPAVGNASFDVASIKPHDPATPGTRIQASPGRFTAVNITLRQLIQAAYQVQGVQIAGGPNWLNADRFDIEAKAEGNPSRDQLSSMIRALLADRFRLIMHSGQREVPIYALGMARSDRRLGPQLRPTDCERPDNQPSPADPSHPLPCTTERTRFGLTLRGASMPEILASLSPWVDRLVLDRTGLTGTFDLDLEWTPDLPQGLRGRGPGEPPHLNGQIVDLNGPSIFTAVQEQLGLKLESTKGPVDILVIDSVSQPTPD
jgi:uncharacterized protein (TIGR03435 family)